MENNTFKTAVRARPLIKKTFATEDERLESYASSLEVSIEPQESIKGEQGPQGPAGTPGKDAEPPSLTIKNIDIGAGVDEILLTDNDVSHVGTSFVLVYDTNPVSSPVSAPTITHVESYDDGGTKKYKLMLSAVTPDANFVLQCSYWQQT